MGWRWAQLLRAFVVLAEEPGSIPSTQWPFTSCITPVPTPSSDLRGHRAHL
ncbi:hypothetical protein I79_005021 [Cricetulus griseus]|uniref:Uncharacterized protein n=1 Tax=Cricetulus griseus TaxID=10029 RepID=G3H426_CRIGR|nr:hypothetical protein I79_005021 [Cricetulus griseus]